MKTKQLNDINIPALNNYIEEITGNPDQAMVDYNIKLEWQGGTKSKVTTKGMTFGEQQIKRDFTFVVDEPPQLLGEDTHPTPQEYLLAGMGSCMMVGYAVGASMMGIELEKLEIEMEAGLNLRGFLEVDPEAPIGFKGVTYTIRVKGNGTKEQFEKIHEKVINYSPNRANITDSIHVIPNLVIEE
ncbi:OsmC family protein [Siminovitchia sediminis]|uniref:OsmC family protein n=1 Tax=Siminovitchia sediminis TaxID=1274353 RepID=A0ABW4KFG8_9BACI